MVALLVAAVVLRFHLTLDIGPVNAESALKQLAKATGEHLVCSPELGREIVAVKATGADWQDLKPRLARVLAGRWRQRKNEWILERPAELAKDIDRKALERRSELIQKEIAVKTKQVEPWTPQYLTGLLMNMSSLAEKEHKAQEPEKSRNNDLLRRTGRGSPAGRALLRVLATMDARELAEVPKDANLVYASRPTAKERALLRVDDILRTFNAEQKEYATEIERRTDLFSPVIYGDPRFNVSSAHGLATRFVMSIRRYGMAYINFSLSAVDDEGWPVAIASDSISGVDTTAVAVPDAPKTLLTFSDSSKEFEKIFMVRSGKFNGDLGDRSVVPALVQKWRPRLVSQVDHEPLGYIVGPALGQCADEMKVDLVAALSDELLTWLPMTPWVKDLTCQAFLEELTRYGYNTTARKNGHWLEVMPQDPNRATSQRLERTLLSGLVTTATDQGRPTVDQLGEYAARQPSDLCFNSLDEMYAAIGEDGPAFRGAGLANIYFRTVLRFWGSLSAQQRRTLREGGTLTLAALSGESRRWLDEYVYGVPQAFAHNMRTPFDPPEESMDRRNIKRYPQEGLPNGLPNSTIIKGVPRADAVVRVIGKSDDIFAAAGEQVGFWIGYSGKPLEGEQSSEDRYQYGDSQNLKLTFDFGGGYSAWTEIGDDPKTFSKPTRYSELPERVRAELEAGHKRGLARKSAEDARAKTPTIPPR